MGESRIALRSRGYRVRITAAAQSSVDGRHVARFLGKIDRSGGPDACWPWTRCVDRYGYGRVALPGLQETGAHRYALALHLGREIPEDKCALHTCDNPPCCNPAHLYEGTRSENMWDASDRGRLPYGPQHHGAKLTEADAIAIARSSRARGVAVQMARRLGVNVNSVYAVRNGRNWRHITGIARAA